MNVQFELAWTSAPPPNTPPCQLSEVASELSVEEEVDELDDVDGAEKMLDQDQSGSESHSTDDHDEFPDTSITVVHVAGETWAPIHYAQIDWDIIVYSIRYIGMSSREEPVSVHPYPMILNH